MAAVRLASIGVSHGWMNALKHDGRRLKVLGNRNLVCFSTLSTSLHEVIHSPRINFYAEWMHRWMHRPSGFNRCDEPRVYLQPASKRRFPAAPLGMAAYVRLGATRHRERLLRFIIHHSTWRTWRIGEECYTCVYHVCLDSVMGEPYGFPSSPAVRPELCETSNLR